VLRFAAFELDLRTQELRKSGVRLRLPKQSFLILAYLAACPGKVVTRDELRHVLWDDKTYVDFDRCLNTAVNRLREVLSDSAESPRFIETLPRKGYRLLAHVEAVVPGVEAPAVVEQPQSPPVLPKWKPPFPLFPALAVLAILPAVWFAVARSTSTESSIEVLSSDGVAVTPSISEDGSRIAFAKRASGRNDHDIYLQKPAAQPSVALTSGPADDFSPSFSPDGRQLAFYRRAGDGAALYLASLDNMRVQRFSGLQIGPPGPAENLDRVRRVESMSWSDDGKYLAYVDRESPTHPYAIFRISLVTRVHEQLTWPSNGHADGAPAFSPDGKWLAFVRSGASGEAIHLLPLAGGEVRHLHDENAAIAKLTWTPDSHNIVFSSERASESRLWSVAIAGGAAQPVTPIRDAAAFPSFSRSGKLAFLRLHPQSKIRVMAISGAANLKSIDLASVPPKIDNPRFSPDGSRIAFSVENAAGHRDIWVSNSDGTAPHALTDLKSICGSPQWSPDGKWIAFDSMARGSWDVYVIPSHGGTPRLLSNHTGDDVRPSWSADGRSIYFASDQSGTMQIWKIARAGGEAQRITTKGGYEAVEAPDGKCVVYARKGVAGLWRSCSSGEERLIVESLQWQHSRNWTVTPAGAYFLSSQSGATYLNMLRFPSLDVTRIASLGVSRVAESGISISQNRLAFIQQDYSNADLAVLSGYR